MIRIAIDGPGGAGKSTIAKKVAKALNLDYIDTGAMYRAIGYKLKKEGVNIKEINKVKAILEKTEIDFSDGNIYLDGKNINSLIRTPEASLLASECSTVLEVREKLVAIQRNLGENKNVIMDGRDIGTNVLKNAEYKFFMTASPEERAQRRYDELINKGVKVKYEEILEDIKKRDFKDSTRELNPLKQAEDAILLETTGMSIEEVTEKILMEVNHGSSKTL